MGIDGFTPEVLGAYPIQVKQSASIGRNVVDNFETAIHRINQKKGYIVAYSFVKGVYEEAARAKNHDEVEIFANSTRTNRRKSGGPITRIAMTNNLTVSFVVNT
jgi:hypothetical protein